MTTETRAERERGRLRMRRKVRHILALARGGDAAIACPECGDAGRPIPTEALVAAAFDPDEARRVLIGTNCTTAGCDGTIEELQVKEVVKWLA